MSHGKVKSSFECKLCGYKCHFELSSDPETFRVKIKRIKEIKGCPRCRKKGDNFVNISNEPTIS